MIKRIINEYPIIKEMFLYGIIGLTCAGIDTLSFIGLRNISVPLFIANFIGINIGITCSFLLNAHFNFKVKDNMGKRALKFFVVGYIGLLISMLVFYIGVNKLQYNEITVKLFSVIFIAIIQFCLNKLFTFNKDKEVANGNNKLF
ncbi:MAG: GtrA family protein [Mollicutes bacterium]|nr:GtrA family protein [Mollicutes bacterium]